LAVLKKLLAVILSFSFFAGTIIMPYSNFDDTCSLRSSYHESQQEDTDMDIGEFVFNKLLTIGGLFDRNDENDVPSIPKNHQAVPLQVQPLQSGSLYCNRISISEHEQESVPAKPTCLYREDKFSFDFQVAVFHPPAFLA
jgi:hypothetical protein